MRFFIRKNMCKNYPSQKLLVRSEVIAISIYSQKVGESNKTNAIYYSQK